MTFSFPDISKATIMKSPGITVHFPQQFQGKATLNNNEHTLIIQLAFFIREVNNSHILQQFSSVVIDEKSIISGYFNKVTAQEKGSIKSFLTFNFDNLSYKVQFKIYIHSLTDFLIGLDAKKATVIISEQEKEDVVYIFYQKL